MTKNEIELTALFSIAVSLLKAFADASAGEQISDDRAREVIA
jgi:hypothetical protein